MTDEHMVEDAPQAPAAESAEAADVPPPPGGGAAYREAHAPTGVVSPGEGRDADMLDAAIAVAHPRPRGRPFDAEIDVAEIDDRGRPGPVFSGRAKTLSRANIVLSTRRMCYVDKELMIAVHLIDDTPIPLYGRVFSCSYDGEGRHVVDVDLLPIRDERSMRAWAESLANK